jgi:hypothetical protein
VTRKLIPALAIALAACNNSTSTLTIGLSDPASVAVFDGLTSKRPDVHPYVAVANAGRDELILIDPEDDKAVMAPILVRALAIPMPGPLPSIVAAADLGDDAPAPAAKRADLLVAVSSGSTTLQLVQTWAGPGGEAAPRVLPDDEVELGGELGGVVLALTAMPVDGKPGHARVVAALSGARIAVVEYVRQGDGSIKPAALVADVQDLRLGPGQPGFDALSLAWDPADLKHLYAATGDRIPTVGGPPEGTAGVAQFDVTGDPGTWTWRALDARAPTRMVAAWTLKERLPEEVAGTTILKSEFELDPVQRVYAFLDPLHCGPDARVGCGIAVIDPVAGGLRADVSGRMPYLAPIPIPNLPTAFAISGPPAMAPPNDPSFADPIECKDEPVGCVIMKVLYGTEPQGTTAVMAVPTTGGVVYYVDLGRWAIPNNTDILRENTRTAPTSAATLGLVPTAQSTEPMALGVWSVPLPGKHDEADALRTDPTGMLLGVPVTPGYTNTDTWTVTFEGVLPGLEARLGETFDAGNGRTRVAVQVTTCREGETPPCTGAPTQVARLYDPALGVRVGDILVVQTAGLDETRCGKTAEGIISEILPPDPAHPGGSVAIEPDPTKTCGTTDSDADVACRLGPTCIADVLRAGTPQAGQPHRVVSVRSGSKVAGTDFFQVLVTSSGLGYAGRARVGGNSTAAGGLYSLEYPALAQGEDALAPGCPLVPWPFPEQVTAATPSVGCDATCRSTCEALVLARKARRIYHVSDRCAKTEDVGCEQAWPPAKYPFPLADGPVIAFRVGLKNLGTGGVETRTPLRGLTLSITTRSGISLASRSPSNLGGSPAYPQGAVSFDKSTYNAGAGYRFYVPYADGHVLDFTPASSASSPTVIR